MNHLYFSQPAHDDLTVVMFLQDHNITHSEQLCIYSFLLIKVLKIIYKKGKKCYFQKVCLFKYHAV